MGMKKKFGEESDFVSVRVPKSKGKEYRNAIKHFVENNFANETTTNNNNSKIKIKKEELNSFRKFEEFINKKKIKDKKKSNI